MDNTLFRSEPAILAVVQQQTRYEAKVFLKFIKAAAYQMPPQAFYCRNAEVVPTPDCKSEAISTLLAFAHEQADIGARIVRIRIHSIRPVAVPGGREPDIARIQPDDHADSSNASTCTDVSAQSGTDAVNCPLVTDHSDIAPPSCCVLSTPCIPSGSFSVTDFASGTPNR